jgi:hypothetical protein
LHQVADSTPLDEFSNAERLAIRDACRARIRDLETRVAVSRRLLALGEDPRVNGWRRTADVLWGLRHLGRRPGASIEGDILEACAAGVLNDLDADFAHERAVNQLTPVKSHGDFCPSSIRPAKTSSHSARCCNWRPARRQKNGPECSCRTSNTPPAPFT